MSIGVRADIALMVISLRLLHSWIWMFDRTQCIAILAGATGGTIAIAIMEGGGEYASKGGRYVCY